MKILLADDTEINRLYLGEALTELGCEVRTCVDGRAALDLAIAESFDLLVLDIRMPQYYGDEVLQRVRQSPQARCVRTPAVAVSSEMDENLAKRLLSEGFVGALLKPVQAVAVLAAAGLKPPIAPRDLHAVLEMLPDTELPQPLDDAQALRALGSIFAVQRVRVMLAQELDARMPTLDAAVENQDAAAIRDWIHQMRASCALCGAAGLDYLLLELRAQVLLSDWLGVKRALREVNAHLLTLRPLLDATDV
jgi:CheY-like chemotaxis protein